jgi:hypothetical protein
MAQEKYPEGYLPKIKYHFNMIISAQEDGNADGMRYSLAKLNYFVEREAQRQEAIELPQLEQEDAD